MQRRAPWQLSALLCLLAALVFAGYGIANAAAQSLFLQIYTAEDLPAAWLGVALTSLLVVWLFNILLQRCSLAGLFLLCGSCSAAVFALLLLAYQGSWPLTQPWPRCAFALYVCKDVYIVVLSELFWAVANNHYGAAKAQRTYGLFCASGSLGGMLGNLLVGPLAAYWGTVGGFYLLVPDCFLAGCGGFWVARLAALPNTLQQPSTAPSRATVVARLLLWPRAVGQAAQRAYMLLRHSRLLPWLLLQVGCVQILLTLIDFDFNRWIGVAYSQVDQRTAMLGQVNALINAGSLILQLSSGVLLQHLGMRTVILAMPLLLGGVQLSSLLLPSFGLLATLKIVSKCNDYSLFRAVKETLYIPLSYREKTEGKALIDMLAYRLAKALAAGLLFLLSARAHPHSQAVGWLSLGLCLGWLLLSCVIERRRVVLLLVLGSVGSLLGRTAWAAPDVLGNNPPHTPVDLLIHPAGSDLSAYRWDCDVFGWNKAFTEVAAVGVETHRGPRGKHRGKAFLLVYALGAALPLHNVIAHSITHPDLPREPVPIEDARDLMWVIENSFLDSWPQRPRHTPPKGAMQVELLWDPRVDAKAVCTPLVGFALSYHGMHRFQPFVALDMHAPCHDLRYTESRLYWGKADVAAAMPRFDFGALASNEQSARFVVSAAWQLARDVPITVQETTPLPTAQRRAVLATLRKFGRLDYQKGDFSGPPPSRPLGVRRLAATQAYADLGRYLARSLAAGQHDVLHDDMQRVLSGFPQIVVELGEMPSPATTAAGVATPPTLSPKQPPPPSQPPPKARYLNLEALP